MMTKEKQVDDYEPWLRPFIAAGFSEQEAEQLYEIYRLYEANGISVPLHMFIAICRPGFVPARLPGTPTAK